VFEFKVALRFLKEGKNQTVFILIGIGIGVAVQVFLYSLISGLQENLIDKTVGSSYHIKGVINNSYYNEDIFDSYSVIISENSNRELDEKDISNWRGIFDEISLRKDVKEIMAIYDGIGIISKGNSEKSILLRGVEYKENNDIYNLKKSLASGKMFSGAGEIVIGKTIANDLNIEVGEFVSINNSLGSDNEFYVSGIYDLDNESINGSWIFSDLMTSQNFFNKKGYLTAIEIQVYDIFQADEIGNELESIYSDMKFENWKENNKSLLSGLRSQSSSSNLIQVFVLLAVALGISSVLAVSVIQKSRQIGILKAMGTTDDSVAKIFLIQGGILGFLGSLLGVFIGISLVKIFENVAATFKVSVSIRTILISILVSTIVGTVSAFIPSRNSAKLAPVEVINNG